MSKDEAFESLGEVADLNLPDVLTFKDFVTEERFRRRQVFDRLYQHIGRLELLGTNDRFRQSYHLTYAGEGITRRALMWANNYLKIGRAFRVVVNDEWTAFTENRNILIRDFIVPTANRMIAVTRSAAVKSRATHTYQSPIHGPILACHDDVVRQHTSSGYKPFMPGTVDDTYLRVLYRREAAEELNGILETLGETSHEMALNPGLKEKPNDGAP